MHKCTKFALILCTDVSNRSLGNWHFIEIMWFNYRRDNYFTFTIHYWMHVCLKVQYTQTKRSWFNLCGMVHSADCNSCLYLALMSGQFNARPNNYHNCWRYLNMWSQGNISECIILDWPILQIFISAVVNFLWYVHNSESKQYSKCMPTHTQMYKL